MRRGLPRKRHVSASKSLSTFQQPLLRIPSTSRNTSRNFSRNPLPPLTALSGFLYNSTFKIPSKILLRILFIALSLRTPRPATGVSRALRARSVPGGSPRVSPKTGGVRGSVRRDVSGALWAPGSGVSKKCPESAPGVSKRCGAQRAPETPGAVGQSLGHSLKPFLSTPLRIVLLHDPPFLCAPLASSCGTSWWSSWF